jgi:hypothetical protein
MSRYYERVSKGLCGVCGKSNNTNDNRCSVCKNKFRDRINQGLCGQCGKKNDSNLVTCSNCRTNKNSARKKIRKPGICHDCTRKVEYGSHCQQCRIRLKQIREKKIKEGICPRCDKPVMLHHKSCIDCLWRYRARNYLGSSTRWKELKAHFDKQGGKCVYSGLPIEFGKNAHLDHIVPKSKGGKNELNNYQWLHKNVNRMKNRMLEDDFLDLCRMITAYTSH